MLSHKTGDCRLPARADPECRGLRKAPPRIARGGLESVAERVGGRNPPIELGHRLPDRIAPPLVRGGRELMFELRPREPQRLECTHPFRIANVTQLCFRAFALQLLHAFLDPRILID